MPSCVRHLLAQVGLRPSGVVPWHEPIPGPAAGEPSSGVYLVALTDDPDSLGAVAATCPLSLESLDALLAARPELSVDGARPTRAELAERLDGSWLPDEVVLYIGLADVRKRPVHPSALSMRVSEYYKTPLGARAPHAGGWFIKTLAAGLFVHYAYTGDVGSKEDDLLRAFRSGVSISARNGLHDQVNVMPFANLVYPGRQLKRHRIDGAKAKQNRPGIGTTPATSTVPADTLPALPIAALRPGAARRLVAATAGGATRPITDADLAAGRIRVGRGDKGELPEERGDIDIVLAGTEMRCRWDPRFKPRERSGVLAVGKSALPALAGVGDAFTIRADETGAVWLE